MLVKGGRGSKQLNWGSLKLGGASLVIESVKTELFNQLLLCFVGLFSSSSIDTQRRPTLSALWWPYGHFGLRRK